MPKTHDKFHSTNGKRQILICDDEAINREILGSILEDSYELIYAEDGIQAMEMIRENKETLSLILLDILMPFLSGVDILKAVKEEEDLSKIPIIVVTSEQEAEVESLKLGAIDFIPKPYPAPDVIRARVLRTIELHEDTEIIKFTERDELTGLYNKEYFFRYADQFDQFHKTMDMDAIIVDINHFHMINERFGRAYGDEVLARIGQKMKEIVQDGGGITCRREADTFLIYCPHQDDHKEILDSIQIGLSGDELVNDRVRLRMGVYSLVDKEIDIERRFDRAKIACDSVKGNFTKTIGVYDNTLHEKELYAEQLIEDFHTAIDEEQFVVYYQPKFDVRLETPLLASAEALVRWNHPRLGMISPGIFIPLFENNGLIQELDTFVWKKVACQIREWKEKYDYSVPVSVNVSRIDMYDPNLVGILTGIVKENDLTCSELMLEVTESAYTQDAEQIISTINELRDIGFQIEMDDFGTGYSSLNMISTIPIDVLKLDMQFIRNAFKKGGNTRMLEVIIEIADYLKVPVIAEGVETEEQLDALKTLGCDLVQGYFFSKPVPSDEFEPFILQRKEAIKSDYVEDGPIEVKNEKTHDLMESYILESGRYSDTDAEHQDGDIEAEKKTGLHIRTANFFVIIITLCASVALLIANISVRRGYERMETASDRYIEAQLAASEMESASDYLTDRVRCFVVTGDGQYLDDFFEEVEITRRRDDAVSKLEYLLKGREGGAITSLHNALRLSNELVETEYYAMRLRLESDGTDYTSLPDQLKNIELSEADQKLSKEQKRDKAATKVFDSEYMHYKDRIRENVNICTQELMRNSSIELEESSSKMAVLVNIQSIMTLLFLVIVLVIVYIIREQIRKPLTQMVEKMQKQEPITPIGAEELRFVTRTYNKILNENRVARERLSHEASHDALTGLFNRGAYDMLMQSVDTSHMALILIDVDYFKLINDTYGHAVGDRVLKRVADILLHSFRSVDIISRIGGDEFAVVMTRSNSSMKQIVLNKIEKANDVLSHPKDDLPPVTLSVGVAFSDRENPQGDIFKDADTALYRVKEAGRNGCAIYE